MADLDEAKKYIFEKGEKRERASIIKLIAGRNPVSSVFRKQLNLALPWCWIGIRIPQRLLLKGSFLNKNEFIGDVDFLAGNLEPISQEKFQERVKEFQDSKSHPSWAYTLALMKILHLGEIKWIPSLDYIVASEFKASYFDSSNKLKGGKLNVKTQKQIRKQANELCELGFNKVALTKVVVTEPVTTTNLHPWVEAGMRASYAQGLVEKETIIEESDLFGTAVVSVGSIVGELEENRGSESHSWLKDVPLNPITEKNKLLRKVIEKNISEVMKSFPTPKQVPVLILCCSNPKCVFLYVSEANPDKNCPKCNWKPR